MLFKRMIINQYNIISHVGNISSIIIYLLFSIKQLDRAEGVKKPYAYGIRKMLPRKFQSITPLFINTFPSDLS